MRDCASCVIHFFKSVLSHRIAVAVVWRQFHSVTENLYFRTFSFAQICKGFYYCHERDERERTFAHE